MSWETQGRQGHGWSGHGTSPGSPATRSDPTGRSTGIGTLDQRIGTVVGSLLGHFSRAERNHAALRPEGQAAAHIVQAMRVWVAAARLGGDALDKALPGTTSDATASKLREAALLTVRAHDPASLNEAGAVLASAAGTMGLDRWGQFAVEAAHAATAAMAASPVLRTAVIGFEEGAALGVESGPGALLTGLAGAVVGAGIGYYLSGPARLDLFTSPRPPGDGTRGQTPAQSVADGAVGAPAPAQVLAQNPGFAATQDAPANTVATPADTPKIGTVVEAKPPADARPDLEPGPEGVVVSDGRREHILTGDDTGGGHRPGQNVPGKSEFPPGWSDDRIIDAIKEVANDPASSRGPGRLGRILVNGSRGGVDITVIVEGDKTTVVSGFPTNRPRNPK